MVNPYTDTVYVDLAVKKMVAAIRVKKSASNIAVNPSTNKVYVSLACLRFLKYAKRLSTIIEDKAI